MRPVMTMKPVYVGNKKTGMEDLGKAVFHQWGVEYEEFETGPGNYTVAIVELPSGEIQTHMPEHIRFLDGEDASEAARNEAFGDLIIA